MAPKVNAENILYKILLLTEWLRIDVVNAAMLSQLLCQQDKKSIEILYWKKNN